MDVLVIQQMDTVKRPETSDTDTVRLCSCSLKICILISTSKGPIVVHMNKTIASD